VMHSNDGALTTAALAAPAAWQECRRQNRVGVIHYV
jgi:hypothetical protein